jgi:aspartyl-tRNA(Asn)/glutamyl-tRNA(Gln) amidotransferase subunit A
MDLIKLTIDEAAGKLQKKEISAVDLTRAYLEKIKKEDNQIHAFLTLAEDQALEAAHESDERRAKGEGRGALDGIPLAIKDNIVTKGIRTTAASKILENFIPTDDAFVIEKLKGAGAVILGKTNLDEFAFGSSTENSAFGPTRNPYDKERVPGGSSGGSAAAVAANFCAGALGSDTGGSIRQPASFCGVVGFKPSYGRVSRNGLLAFGSSLDQIGPLAKSVLDAELIYSAIAGKDKKDATTIEKRVDLAEKIDIAKLKIGMPAEFSGEGTALEISTRISEIAALLSDAGAEIVDINLPHLEYSLPVYYIVAVAEASSNLLRYDGIKYGYSESREEQRNKEELDLYEVYTKTRGKGFGAEAKRRIMLGTYALSAGYYDAYYKQASKVRALIAEDFEKAFAEVDIILAPTTPTTAFKLGEKTGDPLSMYLSDICTVPVNLAGLPAISIPVQNAEVRSSEAQDFDSTKSKLPIGLQIIGPWLADSRVLGVAKKIEKIIGDNKGV